MRHNFDTAVLNCQLLGHLEAFVRRGVVDDQNPKAGYFLVQDAADAVAKKSAVLVTGNYNVDGTHFEVLISHWKFDVPGTAALEKPRNLHALRRTRVRIDRREIVSTQLGVA